MRLLLLSLLACGLATGDARYKLAYTVKTNTLLKLVAGIAGIDKLSSAGDEVSLKGGTVMVKSEKTTVIVDYATGKMILIDHVEKNFERLRIVDMQKRMAEDIPGPMVNALKKMFSSDGGSIATKVEISGEGSTAAMASLEKFRARYGLGYLIPAMESMVALTPSVEDGLRKVRVEGKLVTGLKVLIGVEGRVVDAFVEVRDYQETALPDSVFLPPAGYPEVKVP